MNHYIASCAPVASRKTLCFVPLSLALAACAAGVDAGEASSAKVDPSQATSASVIPEACKFSYNPDEEEFPVEGVISALHGGSCTVDKTPTVQYSVANGAGEETLRKTIFQYAYEDNTLKQLLTEQLNVEAVSGGNETQVFLVIEGSSSNLEWGLSVEEALSDAPESILYDPNQLTYEQEAWAEDLFITNYHAFGHDLHAASQPTPQEEAQ